MDSDLEYLHRVTSDTESYGKVNTIWAASSYLALCAFFQVSIILVAFNWPSGENHCDPLYIFLYGHAAFWLITLIIDHYFRWVHHVLYLKGFLEFSETVKKLASFPFLIVSVWNAALLVMLTFYHQRYVELELSCLKNDLESPIISAVVLLLIENFLIFISVIKYIYKVHLFNRERHLPDVQESGRLAPLNSFVSHEVGYNEHVHGLEELLEKQANQIKFFKNENEVLNKKILSLNCQLRGEPVN